MALISKDEVRKIAAMSRIAIREDEIDTITEQLEAVLSYAQRVTEISSVQERVVQNVNITRDDAIISTPAAPLLSRAPAAEESFFVVPAILDNAE